MKFEIQRIILSTIETYISPLKREISDLRHLLNSINEISSKKENEPLISRFHSDIANSHGISKVASQLSTSRKSSQRNLL